MIDVRVMKCNSCNSYTVQNELFCIWLISTIGTRLSLRRLTHTHTHAHVHCLLATAPIAHDPSARYACPFISNGAHLVMHTTCLAFFPSPSFAVRYLFMSI